MSPSELQDGIGLEKIVTGKQASGETFVILLFQEVGHLSGEKKESGERGIGRYGRREGEEQTRVRRGGDRKIKVCDDGGKGNERRVRRKITGGTEGWGQ